MTNIFVPTIKNHISSLDTVAKSNEKESLGRVLSFVDSSHSAVFVYNDDNEFQGLVSPYKTIYYRNYPYTTLVSSIVVRPPKIQKTAKFYEVAKHMVATKIYTLPVFSAEDAIEGVVKGRDIALEAVKNAESLAFIKDNVTLHTPITAPVGSLVSDVFDTLKKRGVSRMILVSDSGAMEGIVARSDLIRSVIKPTSKMRFSNEGASGAYNTLSGDGEKEARKQELVRKFSTSLVFSLPDSSSLEDVITELITSEHSSVVLVDEKKIPTGFLSMRDILQAIALMKPVEGVSIQIKRPSRSVGNEELARATKYLKEFGLKLEKRIKIKIIRVSTDEPKNPKGHTHIFDTTVTVIPVKGEALVASTQEREFFDGIQEATKQIEKQQRRSARGRN